MDWVVSQPVPSLLGISNFSENVRDFRLLRAGASVSATEELCSSDANRLICAPSLQSPIFHIQNLLADIRFATAETGFADQGRCSSARKFV